MRKGIQLTNQVGILLLLLLFANYAFASPFSPPETDKSLEYLSMIFGNSFNPNSTTNFNPVLSRMFEILNAIVITAGGIIVSYIGIVATLNTSQEGQVMGKKWSSIWIPLRSLLGILLMVPNTTSGYSVVQLVVMWVITQGIGAADSIWEMVMNNLTKGITPIATGQLTNSSKETLSRELDSTPVREGLIEQMLYANICLESLKILNDGLAEDTINNNNKLNLSPAQKTLPSNLDITITNHTKTILPGPLNSIMYSGSINYGFKNTNNFNNYICGKINIDATVYENEITYQDTGKDKEADSKAMFAYKTKLQAILHINAKLQSIANRIVKNNIQPRKTYLTPTNDLYSRFDHNKNHSLYNNVIADSKETYLRYMGQLKKPEKDEGKWWQQNAVKGKMDGWISAGSFYFLLSKNWQSQNFQTAEVLPTAEHVPHAKDCSIDHEYTVDQYALNFTNTHAANFINNIPDNIDFLTIHLKEAEYLYDKIQKQETAAFRLNLGLADEVNDNIKPILKFCSNAIGNLQKLLTDESDPLIAQAAFGNALMQAAEYTWMLLTFLFLGISKIKMAIPNVNASTPTWNIITILLSFFAGPLFAVFTMLWLVGVSMAIYIPMVPFLIFNMTAIGWLILVIEAIVAAPIMALALVLPSGDELGKIVPGLNILLNVFFRPILMLFGFVLAANLYKTACFFINYGIGSSFDLIATNAHLQSNANSYFHGSFSMLSWMAAICLYTGLIMTLANKCFALIHLLPDKVMRWMGGSPEQSDISLVNELERKVDSGSQKGQEMVSSLPQAGLQKYKEHMQTEKQRFNAEHADAGTSLSDKDRTLNKLIDEIKNQPTKEKQKEKNTEIEQLY